MKILVLGSGGREHALAWKIAQSPLCEKLFVAPGNAGTSEVAENVDLKDSDFEGIATFSIENGVELIVVGPEAPLVSGIRDFFTSNDKYQHIKLIGPDKLGAELEGSKDFAKEFMAEFTIPTAKYQTFTSDNLASSLEYIDKMNTPIVLKADGLAAGKGVLICESHQEAKDSIQNILINKKFGNAGDKVVIEEFLDGIELSVFVLTDGKDYVILPEAKDYKRIGEGDTGLNTGGMGAVSPVKFAHQGFLEKVEEKVVKPTITGFQKREMDYVGFVFIGLMNVGGEPFVIEYNVRMGDPETEVVIPRIKSDFVDLLWKTATKNLKDYSVEINPETAVTVMKVAGGYPESYEKGKIITGIESVTKSTVFQAGTKKDASGNILSNGGRVLCLTSFGKDLKEALEKSYEDASRVTWENDYFRKDIGQDLLKLS